MKIVLIALAFAFASSTAQAQLLTITHVDAPTVNCLYNPDCTIVVKDTIDALVVPDGTVVGSLQARTFRGQPRSPLEGLYGYQFRAEMQGNAGGGSASCIDTLTIDFSGSIVLADYNGNGMGGDVHVITTGGLGTLAPVAAERVGNRIVFRFPEPLCAGESTFFFGVTSPNPPE